MLVLTIVLSQEVCTLITSVIALNAFISEWEKNYSGPRTFMAHFFTLLGILTEL